MNGKSMKFDTDNILILGYIAISIYIIKSLQRLIKYAQSGEGFGIKQLYKNFLRFCDNNAPAQDWVYVIFGLFCLICTLCSVFTIPSKGMTNEDPLFFFYQTSLMVGVLFTAFHIWPPTLRNKTFIHIFWNLGIFYVPLICVTFFTLLSKFTFMQNTIFLLNMLCIALLIRWRVAIVMIPLGILIGIKSYEAYTKTIVTYDNIAHIEFHITYAYLAILFTLAMCFRPQKKTSSAITLRPLILKDDEDRLSKVERKYEEAQQLKKEIRARFGLIDHDSDDQALGHSPHKKK